MSRSRFLTKLRCEVRCNWRADGRMIFKRGRTPLHYEIATFTEQQQLLLLLVRSLSRSQESCRPAILPTRYPNLVIRSSLS